MLVISQLRAKKLQKRFSHIEDKFDEDVAAFMLTMMNDERDWMWKKHEIYRNGGQMAVNGLQKLISMQLAEYWRIDNVYMIHSELYALDRHDIGMKAFGYSITPTEDGGFWLRQWGRQHRYYRHKSSARRRAMTEIHQEIAARKNETKWN